jgi:phage shock protein PspC (stress-responsive transcriptional regulator)
MEVEGSDRCAQLPPHKEAGRQDMEDKVLQRPTTNRIIAGVCGGLAEYYEISPTLVRVLFVLLSVGVGIPLYIALWIVMPEGEDGVPY